MSGIGPSELPVRDEEVEKYQCVGCGEVAPAPGADTPIISVQFGWRLSRRKLPNGVTVPEWRCPTCWKRYKDLLALAMTPNEGAPVVPVSSNPILSPKFPSEPIPKEK